MIAATMFSGIGAPETAMPHWQWPWHAEIEKFPSAVMAARHPQSTNLGDVIANDFTARARSIATPDVLVFGSPCQDFSIAGRRAGMDGKRGNLSMVALDILGQLRPRWFCFENVPGLLSISNGHGFQWFLRRVDELGYFGSWAGLDAQHFGLAQRRKRLFFVGHSGDWRGPAAVLLEPESLCGDYPPCREAGEEITHQVAPCIGASGRGFERARETRGQDAAVAVSHTLNAKGGSGRQDFESETLIPGRHGDPFDVSEDGTGRGTPLVPVAFDCKAGGNTGFAVGGTAGALRGEGHGSGHAAVAYQCQGTNVGEMGRLRKGDGGVTSGVPFVQSSSSVRRLTPRECERLQGLPDDHTNITYRNKPAADGPRYKALGNSMAVPVMRWILSRIEIVDKMRNVT